MSFDFLDRLSGREMMLIAIIGIPACLVTIGCMVNQILQYLQTTKLTQAEMALKQEMVAQGRSADEIERILKAKAGNAKKRDESYRSG